MRRAIASVLFAGLFSSAAFAEDAAPPPTPAPVVAKKTPLRVVRVLPETHQALLFDKTKGTHVLVEEGKTVDGFKVEEIDEDTVTLTPIDGGAQIVLAGPDPTWRRHRDTAPATKPAAEPQDPYASAGPVDPYDDVKVADAPIAAGEGGVRTAEAPNATSAPVRAVEAPGSQGAVRTVSAETGSAPTSAAPTSAAPTSAAPTADAGADTSTAWGAAPAEIRTASAAAPDAPTVIAKADVNAALKNFGALAGSVRGSFTATGAKLDAVAPDSLLAKAGLHAGDVITSINNQPLRSLDDAANLYARAGAMRTATIQIERAGKPMSLRLAIQ